MVFTVHDTKDEAMISRVIKHTLSKATSTDNVGVTIKLGDSDIFSSFGPTEALKVKRYVDG